MIKSPILKTMVRLISFHTLVLCLTTQKNNEAPKIFLTWLRRTKFVLVSSTELNIIISRNHKFQQISSLHDKRLCFERVYRKWRRFFTHSPSWTEAERKSAGGGEGRTWWDGSGRGWDPDGPARRGRHAVGSCGAQCGTADGRASGDAAALRGSARWGRWSEEKRTVRAAKSTRSE